MSNEIHRNKWKTEPGQLWKLGDHRIACCDCTRPESWDFRDTVPAALVFTSPPYGQQRDYECENVPDWDALMQAWCACVPLVARDNTQVLVNLGMIHRNGEWLPYWEQWCEWMRRQGWLRFALNVWNQCTGLPGDWNGRCAPSFEFIFHFNKALRYPNKWHAKKPESIAVRDKYTMRERDGTKKRPAASPGAGLQPTRIPDNVWTLERQKGPVAPDMDHPAPFPIGLPAYAINTYTEPGEIVFDPFLGSGSTLIACEQTGRHCRGMELSPNYLALVIERWHRLTGGKPECLEQKSLNYSISFPG